MTTITGNKTKAGITHTETRRTGRTPLKNIILTLFISALSLGNITLFYKHSNQNPPDQHAPRELNNHYHHPYPKSQAHRCNNNITAAPFHSQRGEDQFLVKQFFQNLCNGTYIEMGAFDGIKLSNSNYFNTGMNWTGLLIEANPDIYKRLIENRRNELVSPINAAVCDTEQDVHWVSAGPTGGIWEFAPKSFREKWWNKDLFDNAQIIKCLPLNQIIRDAIERDGQRVYFDFFSLDVEGAEYNVLKTIDFDNISFGVIFYESDEHNPLKNSVMRSFLEERGYRFLKYDKVTNWHVNNRFAEIYSDLVRDA